ncbi:para-nitrobenzyl esterase [Glycomyces sambucus]|uniref:Carboxylic ester hydrolase n=1 Tax=Glycomyces sambucus TaxID=380244 RepID=A0A1G9DF20_9ACTN|nr:carboxylesterase family protein [Glycomyces sambucus]SDK62453.1 para-nitrobenzyl esterase [Glycomyces sambucus]
MGEEDARFAEVRTRAGRLRGRWRGEPGTPGANAVFLGIPFAEPPTGVRRFMAPVPKAPWDGVRDALEPGPTPYRKGGSPALIPEAYIPGDETLNIDVFTPDPGPGARLPVLVWIHGGGFTAGSPACPWYDGAPFCRDGVVTANVSYRLGFDGFGWIEGAPANRGALDWLAALAWVQDNIAAFGGDPGRVTVAGQSAGGTAVLALLAAPRAQGLFARGWALSPAPAYGSPERAQAFSRQIAEHAGAEPNLESLLGVTEARLLKSQRKAVGLRQGNVAKSITSALAHGLQMGPVVDGDLLRDTIPGAIAAGNGAAVPLVVGTCDDELTPALRDAKRFLRFLPAGPLLGRVGLTGRARRAWMADNADVRCRGTAAVLARYTTDRAFRAGVLDLLHARARGGATATWLYRFAWRTPVYDAAVHCLDLPFFFDHLDARAADRVTGYAPPQALAAELHGAAVAFAATADPGWPAASPAAPVTRVFDVPSATVPDGYVGARALTAPEPARR